MIQYEVNFIVDPVLSGDEIKTTAKTYEDMLKDVGATIVNVGELGLKQLAYPIKKRTSGIYYCIEFQTPTGEMIAGTELALKRDERILRFLSVRLDKYGVQYNQDRRDGKISSYKKKSKEDKSASTDAKGKSEKTSSSKAKKTLNTIAATPAAAAPAAKAKAKSEEE